RHHLGAVRGAALGARVDDRAQVEHGQRLADLAAERAALELVELDRLLGASTRVRGGEPEAQAEHGGGPGGGDVDGSREGHGWDPRSSTDVAASPAVTTALAGPERSAPRCPRERSAGARR